MYKLLINVLLLLPIVSFSQTEISGGNISGHWDISGSPYLIQGNILIPNADTLAIDAGVVIEFQGKFKLFCNGTILAEGTDEENIFFTTIESSQNGWLGIKFEDTPSTNTPSIFKYCQIKNIMADTTGSMSGSVFFLNYSGCSFDNCLFQDNYAEYGGGALRCVNSNISIKNCSFVDNFSKNGGHCIEIDESEITLDQNYFNGSGIYSYDSDLTITNNIFENSVRQGGITSFAGNNGAKVRTIKIINNLFENNVNANGAGGGGVLLYDMEGIIQNNIFKGNSTNFGGGGIACTRRSTYPQLTDLFISNNLFYDNSAGSNLLGLTFGGGGINIHHMSPTVTNNTFIRNKTDLYGGAIFCGNDSDPLFYNNIIFDNNVNGIDNIFVNDNDSNPSFYHNIIQDNINSNGNPISGDFVANLDTYPNFVDTVNQDFSLLPGSPCINTGLPDTTGLHVPMFDLNGNSRIVDQIIDIGAYEYQQPLFVSDITNNGDFIKYYPNPASAYLNFENVVSKVWIFSQNGQLIKSSEINASTIDISDLEPGIYFFRLKSKNKLKKAKVVIN